MTPPTNGATPQAKTSEVLPGLPPWCSGLVWDGRTRKVFLHVKLPTEGVLSVLSQLRGVQVHMHPMAPAPAVLPVTLQIDPKELATMIEGLTRCLDESRRVVIDAG